MASISGSTKLEHLRRLMKNVCINKRTGIEAYLVTPDDAHQSEYVRDRDKRRQFISGFKGSSGTAVITLNNALLWTDGRYFSQATFELDPPEAWTLMKDGSIGTPTISEWLVSNLPPNSIVGADPHLMSNTTWTHLQNSLKSAGHDLLPTENNLIDQIWGDDRPAEILNEVVPHKLIYSGRIAGDKIEDCFDEMEKNKVAFLVLTALDEIAYLLNWRGSDISYNPVFFAYVILYQKQVHIFIEEKRVTADAKQQLKEEKVDFVFHPYDNVRQFLRSITDTSDNNVRGWIANSSSHALYSDCNSKPVHATITPVNLMKLVKNDAEMLGMKSAHIRDGVALVKYYAWLEQKIKDGDVVTEISGAEQLEKFRKLEDKYVGPSFPTISAAGKHGAINHYLPAVETDLRITSQEFYLCDAGAQFLDGTTDVTRTLHFGEPSDYEIECFTRVFKGQCNVAMAKFPAMIKGNYLDTLARKYLWDVGLDYLHGTGHGVGAYLNVHEYPTMISWRPYPDDPGMQAGMFLSNEPGYYEDEKFGIRLENIEMVTKATTKYNRLNREFLAFETVTLVPIQTRCLKMSMLTDDEVEFINNYHRKCYDVLNPYLQGPENVQALHWLEKETQPIKK